jgi:L-lysine 6-transaminase
VSSRINSTWGGNLTDMVRARIILETIESDHLVDRAAENGAWLLERLTDLARRRPVVTDPRGRGLMCAISLPDTATRDEVLRRLAARNILILGCGRRSIRFRPALTITVAELGRAVAAVDDVLAGLTLKAA